MNMCLLHHRRPSQSRLDIRYCRLVLIEGWNQLSIKFCWNHGSLSRKQRMQYLETTRCHHWIVESHQSQNRFTAFLEENVINRFLLQFDLEAYLVYFNTFRWFLENLQMISFISPKVCRIVVWFVWTEETGTAPEPPPMQLSKSCSQNSAALSPGGFVVLLSLLKLLAFTIAATAFWAAFLHWKKILFQK